MFVFTVLACVVHACMHCMCVIVQVPTVMQSPHCSQQVRYCAHASRMHSEVRFVAMHAVIAAIQ